MTKKNRIFPSKRKYNQWVANETLEDFALRYTARRARKWSGARIANTALGIVSFLALEAIGGAITLQYGFTNSMWAILVVCSLIFLTGLPVCYYAAKSGLDIDLLTRGAGFGYIGSTISSLIYASFTFIFFALEAAIMSMALQLLFGIPLFFAYIISAVVVIPLVTHGITRISRFQLWTQPIWIVLQIAPLLFILYHHAEAFSTWTHYPGAGENSIDEFNFILFGAAAAVIFPLIAQNGEQVDFLRFLPKEKEDSKKWWLSLTLAGPGWSIFGLLKLFAGSFLAVLALQHGVDYELADDPTHMYLVAFSYITSNPELALVLVATFVIISQLKINVTNAYAGSIAWSNFFSRLTHDHPGRIVWLFFNVAIALLLMELGLYQAFETILVTYSALVLAWIGSLVADLVINKPLGLRPQHIEFKRGHLYDINPVGVVSMLIASTVGICGQIGLFGELFKAMSPFIALFLPFITAPIIAYLTKGKYYIAREESFSEKECNSEIRCMICENSFDHEDMSVCPAYQGNICSLCCSLDSSCHDQCRPRANAKFQILAALNSLLPLSIVKRFDSVVGHYLLILFFTSSLIAALFALVDLSVSYSTEVNYSVSSALWQTFSLLMIVTGVLVWLYVLAENSRRKALQESQKQTELLIREAEAHEKTSSELQAAKEVAVAANQAKSRYLSGVSHELRTPLNTIYGYAQILESDSQLPKKNRESATAIRRNSEHLADVIEGLLEISKIEARRLDLHRDQVKIVPLIEQMVEMFGIQARAKGINFKYLCLSELPSYVFVDEKRLRQILMNLLSNAVKFTHQGKVTLQVSYRNEVAKFVITDTGVGIEKSDQERIFDPFERIHNKETQSVSGTGLGLSISRLLCHLLGGDISVKSVYGEGSCFTLTILLPSVIEPNVQPIIHKTIKGYKGETKNIMVVDDASSHRSLISDFLSPLGFKVIEANGAEMALKFIDEKHDEQHVDLFLLDVSMPFVDGWELASQLRKSNLKVPIVMLSANAIEDHREEMSGRLHDEYLIKPIRRELLLEKLGALLKLSWDYEEPAKIVSTNVEHKNRKKPMKADLDELLSLVEIGYLNGIIEKIDQMKQDGFDYELLTYLKERAELCDFKAVIETIQELDEP